MLAIPAADCAGAFAAAPLLAEASGTSMRIGLTVSGAEPAQEPSPAPASLDYPASPNAVLCRSEGVDYRECAARRSTGP
jgi:hypothetical protein